MIKANRLVLLLIIGYLLLSINTNGYAQDEKLDSLVTQEKQKKTHKRTSDFKIYGGVTSSKIQLSDEFLQSAFSAGFNLGLSIRNGRFAYWEKA